MKKQIFFTVLFFLAALPAGAQLYLSLIHI